MTFFYGAGSSLQLSEARKLELEPARLELGSEPWHTYKGSIVYATEPVEPVEPVEPLEPVEPVKPNIELELELNCHHY